MIPALDRVHHDGSSLYVEPLTPKLKEEVTVRLRVPAQFTVEAVYLRVPIDAEPVLIPAVKTETSSADVWWSATFVMTASQMSYRWLLVGGDAGYLWITAAGNVGHETTDATDFKISCHSPIPEWATGSIAYEIFPDRFARSGRTYVTPDWAVPRAWDQHPEGRSPNTAREYYGGDLWGIIDRLDHIQALGANLIYTTPFFPARSTHRYDASTFEHVDPLLGGDEALIALVEAAHARGMKVIGDITLNHSGDAHEWFLAGQSGDVEKQGFYYFDETEPFGYATWLGVKSLPKFNFASEQLREELISAPNSILRRYLKAPFNLDGWRVDVANMTARFGDYDANHEIARLTRTSIEAEGADKILIGEHNHNAGPDLPGDGWFGNMNYTSFQRPIWAWLSKQPSDLDWHKDVSVPLVDGHAMVSTMKTMHASTPWKALNASWNLLASHDSPRIRTMVGSAERQEVAALLMCTLPGTPMIFAEDEIGAEGRWGEDSRTPFPWDRPELWDMKTFKAYQQLISIRKSERALASGGLRFVAVQADLVAFLRETRSERLLVVAARNPATVTIDGNELGFTTAELLYGNSTFTKSAVLEVSFTQAGGAIWKVS